MGDILLLLPDFTVLLARLLRDPRVPRRSKLIALFGIGYVLSPIDLLPALLLGPLGPARRRGGRDRGALAPDQPRPPRRRARGVAGTGRRARRDPALASWCERFLGRKLRGFVRGALRLEQR
jgi:hypothetical protein